MNTALRVPDNNSRPIVGIDPDLDNTTPIDCLRDGKQWACDSFVEWVKAEKDGKELYDLLLSTTPGLSISDLKESWSKQVLEEYRNEQLEDNRRSLRRQKPLVLLGD